MQTSVELEGAKAVIKLAGRFDFSSHRDFRASYEDLLGRTELREFVVDLARVDYLDSSALGMLLLLRDKVLAVNKTVALANCQGNVRQVLDIANFGKLFTLS